jgi:hypothetical protein
MQHLVGQEHTGQWLQMYITFYDEAASQWLPQLLQEGPPRTKLIVHCIRCACLYLSRTYLDCIQRNVLAAFQH